MEKEKVQTWVKSSNREVLIDYHNAMMKRIQQMHKWKKPPSESRYQKELLKITDKYVKMINPIKGIDKVISYENTISLNKQT